MMGEVRLMKRIYRPVAVAALALVTVVCAGAVSGSASQAGEYDGVWQGTGHMSCEGATALISTEFVVQDGGMIGEARTDFRGRKYVVDMQGSISVSGTLAARGGSTKNVSSVYRFDGSLANNRIGLHARPPHSKTGCTGHIDVALTKLRDLSDVASAADTPANADNDDPLGAKLVKLKKLVEQGLITEEESATKRARLLEDF